MEEPLWGLPGLPDGKDPHRPWALSHNDRWFLMGIGIKPENETTPYPPPDGAEEDGA